MDNTNKFPALTKCLNGVGNHLNEIERGEGYYIYPERSHMFRACSKNGNVKLIVNLSPAKLRTGRGYRQILDKLH
jgi:hypothetical protein